jgi:hypothetical protein
VAIQYTIDSLVVITGWFYASTFMAKIPATSQIGKTL